MLMPSESSVRSSIGVASAPASQAARSSASSASRTETSRGPWIAELRRSTTRPDLHPDVGSGEPGEAALVGDVVAHEECRAGTGLVPQHVDRVALVALDDRQLEHLVALGHVHTVHVSRPAPERVEDHVGVLPGGAADVHGDARRLLLQQDSRDTVHEAAHGPEQRGAKPGRRPGQGPHEADVELRPVAADEMDLGGEPRQGGEVAQRPARDDRGRRARESRERPQRADALR